MKNKNMYRLLIVLMAVVTVAGAYSVQAVYAREAESGRGSSVGSDSGFDSARDIAERGGVGAVSPGVHASGFDSPRDMQERAAFGSVSSSPFHVSGFDSSRDIAELALKARGVDDSFHFEHTMRRGMRNDDVIALQIELGNAGVFNGSVDGSFGNITRRSVMAFQKRHGLRADGIVGRQTRGKLNEFRFARLSGMDSARDLQEVGALHP